MKKLSIMVLILLTGAIASAEINIEKYFNDSDGRIDINIQSTNRITNATVIDSIPFSFSAENISGNGALKKSGILSFIEWNISLEGETTLSYLPEKIMDFDGGITLLPPRLFLADGGVIYGNGVNLTPEDVEKVRNRVCKLDGFCAYPNENHLNCPGDCPSGGWDGKCDGLADNVCDPDCVRFRMRGNDPDCTTTTLAKTLPTTPAAARPAAIPTPPVDREEKRNPNGYLPYIIGAIVLVAIILVAVRSNRLRRIKEREREEEKRLRKWTEDQLRNGEDPELLKKALKKQNSDPAMVDEIMERL